jgi:geranylgeranyl reductase family protein
MRDVIIVGGGPAGSASATFLARAGWDVLLLDRAQFPRDKACGEFLTPATKPLFEQLGVWDRLCARGLHPVAGVTLYSSGNGHANYLPVDGAPAGYSMRRRILDAELLQNARAAGAEVREGARVRGLLFEGRRIAGVTVTSGKTTEELKARLVIGSDGTHSLVARQMGVVRPLRRLQRVAVVSHWKGLPDAGAIEMRSKKGVVCGLGPLSDGAANITVVVSTAFAARIAGRPGEFLSEEVAAHFPDLADRLAGGQQEAKVKTVGCFGHLCSRATADGAMLVGDAAAFIDPFTGEGVYFALRGAQLAAQVTHQALQQNDLSSIRLAEYDRLRKELFHRYLLCGVVQGVVRNPFLMNRVVNRCEERPELAAGLMEVLGDLRPARQALNARFALKLFS